MIAYVVFFGWGRWDLLTFRTFLLFWCFFPFFCFFSCLIYKEKRWGTRQCLSYHFPSLYYTWTLQTVVLVYSQNQFKVASLSEGPLLILCTSLSLRRRQGPFNSSLLPILLVYYYLHSNLAYNPPVPTAIF